MLGAIKSGYERFAAFCPPRTFNDRRLGSAQPPDHVAADALPGERGAGAERADGGILRAARIGRADHLRGDLDRIFLRALQSEPSRRYGSVDDLAEDIRCHLDRLPIAARKITYLTRALRRLR